MASWRFFALVAVAGLVLGLSNRWLVTDPDMSILRFDSISYLEIARSAPELPKQIDIKPGYPELEETLVVMPHHHAQRFAGPLVVGVLAKALGVRAEMIFAVVAFVLVVATGLILSAAVPVALSPGARLLAFGAYFFNPYTVRFYLAVPTYLGDILFLFFFACALYALVKGRAGLLLLALLGAALGRQTALLLLPGVFVYLAGSAPWRRQWRMFAAAALGSVGVVATYIVTDQVAYLMSPSNINANHLFELFHWLAAQGLGGTKELVAFLLRGVLGVALPLAMVVAAWDRRRLAGRGPRLEVCGLLLLCLGVISQPVLGGPALTGDTINRLTALGAPALYVLAFRFWPAGGVATGPTLWLGAALLLGISAHHRYTWLANTPLGASAFPALALSLACVVAFAVFTARLWRRA